MSKEFTDSFLDEQEQAYIKQFAQNEKMKEAVKKVVLSGIYEQGVMKKGRPHLPGENFVLGLVSQRGMNVDDEVVGQDVRACSEGIRLVLQGFQNLELYDETESKGSKKNDAL